MGMSDRCTYWLTDSHTRYVNYLARQQAHERQEFLAMAELVIEVVHPGNLEPLPPSPDKLRAKAWLLGLDK